MDCEQKKEAYTGDFEPRTNDDSEGVVEKLLPIIEDNESLILFTLPSVRRVQRIFGDAESLDNELFRQNIEFDLSIRTDSQTAEEASYEILSLLRNIELALYEHYVYEPLLNEEEKPYTIDRINILGDIITRTLYREWNPETKDHGIIDSLLKHIHGNIKYTRLTQIRDERNREAATPFDTDSKDDEIRRLAWTLTRKAGDRITAPSAESEFFRIEQTRQLYELALESDEMVFTFLTGTPVEDIAEATNSSTSYVTNYIRNKLLEIVEKGQDLYDWSNGFTSFIFQQVRSPKRTREDLPQVIPTPSERQYLFSKNKTTLENLFACIQSLPIVQQKFILRYFGYIGDGISDTQWLVDNQFSEKLYRTTLHKVFKHLESELSHPPALEKKPIDIIQESDQYVITKSSEGRNQNEKSTMLRLIQLRDQITEDGCLNQQEKRLLTEVWDFYNTTGKVPTRYDLQLKMEIKPTTLQGVIMWLLAADFDSPRYSTKDYTLARGKSRHEAIEWYKKHKDNPQSMMQLLSLSPRQFRIFMASVTLTDGFYLTSEEVAELDEELHAVKPERLSHAHIQIVKQSLIQIKKGYPIHLLYQALKESQRDSTKPEFEIARKALLTRIEQGLPIGRGAFKEMAKELGISSKDIEYVSQQARKKSKSS